jgi:hypothetical protein
MDPWIPLIEEAKQRSNIAFEEMKESLINSGLGEQSAKDKAYSNILPTPKGTGKYLYGASRVDETTKERSNT